jgi:1,4-dihydroxy-2-naphthoate octaprenyltransferase
MANVSMWGKALRTIPRVTKEEWKQLDVISRWLIASRAAVFIMTVIAACVGGLLAYYTGSFNWLNFVMCIIGLTFAHATNNLINDYIDYKKGIDHGNYYRSLYGPQPLEHGLMSKKQLLGYIVVTFTIALASGIYLVIQTGTPTLVFLLAGVFFVIFYTWPLKYIGLGEPSVMLVWGPLMVGGTFYATTGNPVNWDIALIGLVYAIGPTTVLFGKHTDKIIDDKKKGVHTLPVILGEKYARYTTIGLWILQYIFVALLVIYKQYGISFLLVLLAMPKLFWASKIFAKPRPKEAPANLPPNTWPLYLSSHAFVYNRNFSMLFLLGLVADIVMKSFGISIL